MTTFYRCRWHVPGAEAGEPGHPSYVHPRQGQGRLDDPQHEYKVWYVAREPEAAVAEVFGDFAVWEPALLEPPPFLPGAVRALVTYDADVRLCDMDDPAVLLTWQVRPSRVVTRDRAVTQAWARAIYNSGGYDGVAWWSYRDPRWSVCGIWHDGPVAVRDVTPITSLDAAVVRAAADVLCRHVAA